MIDWKSEDIKNRYIIAVKADELKNLPPAKMIKEERIQRRNEIAEIMKTKLEQTHKDIQSLIDSGYKITVIEPSLSLLGIIFVATDEQGANAIKNLSTVQAVSKDQKIRMTEIKV
jgi:hypothetical protein